MIDISKLKFAIFDWDNTLADSRPHIIETINKILPEYNLPVWDIVKRRRDPGLSFRDNFVHIFGPSLAAEAYERYVELYKNRKDFGFITFPGVKEVIDNLYGQGVKLFIMTNKDRRLFDLELPQLFDPRLFVRTVAGHEAPRDKPSPEQVYFLLRGLLKPEEITPENVWIIGDSAHDSSCALAAGAQAIRIGQPIWGDDAGIDDRIVCFRDFLDFAAALKGK